MNIITIANHKGGVGKTATAQNLGAGLALKGYKVLLIDLDAQANLSVSFGINIENNTIYEAFRGEIDMPIYSIKDNLDIVPSNLNLSAIEIELQSQAGRDFFLKSMIKKLKKEYDYILIDCPPSIGVLTVNSLTASNKVIIPMEAHFLAVQGITKIYDIINIVAERLNPSLSILGILITKYDNRRILERDIKNSIEGSSDNFVFQSFIRNNVSIAEATYNGKDIFDYSPKSNGAVDYQSFVDEISRLFN